MIDFAAMRSIDSANLQTHEEKLIIILLTSKSCTVKEIYSTLRINASGCRRTLKRLVNRQIIETFTNHYELTEYRISVQNTENRYRIPKNGTEYRKTVQDIEKRYRIPKNGTKYRKTVQDTEKRYRMPPFPLPFTANLQIPLNQST